MTLTEQRWQNPFVPKKRITIPSKMFLCSDRFEPTLLGPAQVVSAVDHIDGIAIG